MTRSSAAPAGPREVFYASMPSIPMLGYPDSGLRASGVVPLMHVDSNPEIFQLEFELG